jgi:hypothetical protein
LQRLRAVPGGEAEMTSESDIYEPFIGSDEMKVLTDTDNVRVEEEFDRPRVEIWPDDVSWQEWIASHEPSRKNLICGLESMRATPYCAMGYH